MADMSSRSAQEVAGDFLTEMRRGIEEYNALVAAVGADPTEVNRCAERCHGLGRSVLARAAADPDGWWPALQAEAARHEEEWRIDWRRAVAWSFSQVLEKGEGPVDALRLGVAGIRAHVPAKLLQLLDGWAPDQGGLVLTGASESGKTMGALALAMRLHQEANAEVPTWHYGAHPGPLRPVMWLQAGALARARDQWRIGTAGPEVEQAAVSAPILVLDDLLYAGHRIDSVLEVLGARLNAARPTITTTGFPEAELRKQLGDAGVRRLLRVGAAEGRIVQVRKGAK